MKAGLLFDESFTLDRVICIYDNIIEVRTIWDCVQENITGLQIGLLTFDSGPEVISFSLFLSGNSFCSTVDLLPFDSGSVWAFDPD